MVRELRAISKGGVGLQHGGRDDAVADALVGLCCAAPLLADFCAVIRRILLHCSYAMVISRHTGTAAQGPQMACGEA